MANKSAIAAIAVSVFFNILTAILPVSERWKIPAFVFFSICLIVALVALWTAKVHSLNPENAESYVKEWLDSLAVPTKKIEDHPARLFAYGVTYSGGVEIGVSQTKDRPNYIVGLTTINLSENDQALLDKQSHPDKQEFARALVIEAGRAKMDIQMAKPYHSIQVRKLMPLGGLTEETLKTALHSLQMECRLIVALEESMLNEFKIKPPS